MKSTCLSFVSVNYIIRDSYRRSNVRTTHSQYSFLRISKLNPAGHPLAHLNLKLLPSNVTIVPEIKCFPPPEPSIVTSRVEFVNGTVGPSYLGP